ncbi:MAG: response regulator [Candidatus Thorarchaeota archaeon]
MSPISVLIAEQEVVISLDLKLFLKNNNFKIISIVNNGKDLIIDYKLKKPDLMIMDFDFKFMNAMKEIRKTNHPPIIFISGFYQPKLEKFCNMFSPCTVLKKPILKTELLKSIMEYFPI